MSAWGKIKTRVSDPDHVHLVCHPKAETRYSLCTKFDDSSFSRSRDIIGPKIKNGSRDPDHVPFEW